MPLNNSTKPAYHREQAKAQTQRRLVYQPNYWVTFTLEKPGDIFNMERNDKKKK